MATTLYHDFFSFQWCLFDWLKDFRTVHFDQILICTSLKRNLSTCIVVSMIYLLFCQICLFYYCIPRPQNCGIVSINLLDLCYPYHVFRWDVPIFGHHRLPLACIDLSLKILNCLPSLSENILPLAFHIYGTEHCLCLIFSEVFWLVSLVNFKIWAFQLVKIIQGLFACTLL